MLKGKKILVGVTGGIAAYKTATIVRLLVREEAEVKVIMTDHAREFITPLTLATLSKNPVLTQFYNPENGDWNSHVDLGLWADLYLIAPATANSIGKMANGLAGKGRMAEPEEIVKEIKSFFAKKKTVSHSKGKKS